MDNELTGRIIGAAIEVHRILGPGLLESVYEECLCKEFDLMGIEYDRQKSISIDYKGHQIDCNLRIDLIVEKTVIIELKSVESILPVHHAQLLTYLKLTHKKLGLIINFNVPVLKNGIKRIIN